MSSASAEKFGVLVLAGGPSAEREVSLASGAAVAQALTECGHHVRCGDIDPQDLSALDGDDYQVVFPVLHGAFGEDGQLQYILDKRRIPYVGSDAASSYLAMDKYYSKHAFIEAGLDTGKSILIEHKRLGKVTVSEITKAVEFVGTPCVVKPNCQGSSLGVVIARENQVAQCAVPDMLARYGDCLVEEFIPGWELTVGILDGQALPMIEITTGREFYDYDAKYLDDDTQYLFDTHLSQEQLHQVSQDAQRAFAALGCRDYGRVDMILEPSGRDCILEVNTIPGFTSHSLVPKAAARNGMTLGQMCERIISLALQR